MDKNSSLHSLQPLLRSAEYRKSYRFGATWEWVNDDLTLIFGWTLSLNVNVPVQGKTETKTLKAYPIYSSHLSISGPITVVVTDVNVIWDERWILVLNVHGWWKRSLQWEVPEWWVMKHEEQWLLCFWPQNFEQGIPTAMPYCQCKHSPFIWLVRGKMHLILTKIKIKKTFDYKFWFWSKIDALHVLGRM